MVDVHTLDFEDILKQLGDDPVDHHGLYVKLLRIIYDKDCTIIIPVDESDNILRIMDTVISLKPDVVYGSLSRTVFKNSRQGYFRAWIGVV